MHVLIHTPMYSEGLGATRCTRGGPVSWPRPADERRHETFSLREKTRERSSFRPRIFRKSSGIGANGKSTLTEVELPLSLFSPLHSSSLLLQRTVCFLLSNCGQIGNSSMAVSSSQAEERKNDVIKRLFPRARHFQFPSISLVDRVSLSASVRDQARRMDEGISSRCNREIRSPSTFTHARISERGTVVGNGVYLLDGME